MHIAQFVHRYPPALGGAEAYAARLTGFLREQGDTADVWTTTAVALDEFWRGNRRPTLITENLRRYQPLSFPLRRYLLKAMSMLLPARWRSFALRCNPVCPRMWKDAGNYDGPLDAVHATAFPYAWPILCARRLARTRRVPFLLTPFLHLSDERTKKQYLQPALLWLLRDADAVFAQTELEREAMIAAGVDNNRIVLQGLGVDTSEVTNGNRDRFRKKYQINRHDIVIGHLANLSYEKGSMDLVDACRGLNCKVLLAGPSMPRFRDYLRDHPSDNVILTGALTDEERRDLYAAIDVFALPSRSDSFGLVLLEAWANAKPVVAYNLGGPGEIIRHGIDGLLAQDQMELRNALQSLISNSQLRTVLGASGQQRLPQDFDWHSKLDLFRDTAMHLIHTSPADSASIAFSFSSSSPGISQSGRARVI